MNPPKATYLNQYQRIVQLFYFQYDKHSQRFIFKNEQADDVCAIAILTDKDDVILIEMEDLVAFYKLRHQYII